MRLRCTYCSSFSLPKDSGQPYARESSTWFEVKYTNVLESAKSGAHLVIILWYDSHVELSLKASTNLVHQGEGVILVGFLPGVVRQFVQEVQHLCLPVLGSIQRPVVEHVTVVGKEVNCSFLNTCTSVKCFKLIPFGTGRKAFRICCFLKEFSQM